MIIITMSFLGPAKFLANRSEFKKRLIQEKENQNENENENRTKSYKINSNQPISSYQNNALYISVYLYKIDNNICFVRTNNNEEMVIPRNKERIYYISQQMTVLKDFSKLPYTTSRYICFSTKKYYYAKECQTV